MMNGTELRSFSHFEIFTKIAIRTFAEIFKVTNVEGCLHSL